MSVAVALPTFDGPGLGSSAYCPRCCRKQMPPCEPGLCWRCGHRWRVPYLFTTASGRSMDPEHPRAEDVCLDDIVAGLSHVQRYGGQLQVESYTVAEHSVLVSRICRPRNAILGLLHDASEAYIGDVITQVKRALPKYKEIERRWMLAIGEAAGLGGALADLPIDVHVADLVARQTEWRDLFRPGRVKLDGAAPAVERVAGLRPRQAAALFRARLRELLPGWRPAQKRGPR